MVAKDDQRELLNKSWASKMPSFGSAIRPVKGNQLLYIGGWITTIALLALILINVSSSGRQAFQDTSKKVMNQIGEVANSINVMPMNGGDWMSGLVQFTRQCMIRKLTGVDNKQIWSNALEEAITECGVIGFPYIQTFRNRYDAKRMLRTNPGRRSCTFVTLGVGQKVQVEVAFKQMYPHCEFFGADPVDEGNRMKYEQVGTFFNFAVSGGNSSFSKLLTEGHYTGNKDMQAVPFVNFLEKHVQRKHLDFLMIDTEWGEYGLLDMLHGSSAQQSGYRICQFDIEVHQPNANQLDQFVKFLLRLLDEDTYTIASSFKEGTIHFRFFAFNHRDPECTKSYFKSIDNYN